LWVEKYGTGVRQTEENSQEVAEDFPFPNPCSDQMSDKLQFVDATTSCLSRHIDKLKLVGHHVPLKLVFARGG